MTESLAPHRGTAAVTIRAYRPGDHRLCRMLWAELADERRRLYSTGSGDETGAGFEEYLTRLDLAGVWVAEHPADGVVGMVGLLLNERAGQVDPVVVTARRRGQGIGRALVGYVAERARGRGLRELAISPDTRNVAAIRCFQKAGYTALARVTLTMELNRRGPAFREGIDLHGVTFRY